MPDNPETKNPQEQVRAASRSAAQSASETVQRGAATIEQAGRSGSEAIERSGRAGAQTMRHLTDAAGGAAQGTAHGFIEVQQEFAEQAARQFETAMRNLRETFADSAQEWRTLMQIPATSTVGVQDVQRTMTHTVEAVMRTNMQAAQEIFRNTNLMALAGLQQRFMRGYLNAFLDGSTAIARAVRQSADQMLQPLEERMVHQRHNGFGRGGHRQHGRVRDVMEREVRLTNPEDTVQQAARIMREEDTGALPVGEGDRIVGMVTDRDVALRLVAEGRDPARTKVREVMSEEIRYVYEDEDLERVAENMAQQKVRRLPVMNRQKRLVGVVSLGDLARERPDLAGRAMEGVAGEGGQHTPVAAE